MERQRSRWWNNNNNNLALSVFLLTLFLFLSLSLSLCLGRFSCLMGRKSCKILLFKWRHTHIHIFSFICVLHVIFYILSHFTTLFFLYLSLALLFCTFLMPSRILVKKYIYIYLFSFHTNTHTRTCNLYLLIVDWGLWVVNFFSAFEIYVFTRRLKIICMYLLQVFVQNSLFDIMSVILHL